MQMLLPLPEITNVCCVETCGKVSTRLRRGMCSKHYRAFILYGDPLLTWQDVKPEKLCSIDGCSKPSWARGWCSLHWQRWRKHGDPSHEPTGKKWPDVCIHPECDRPSRKNGGGKGYCAMHYGRLLRHGDVGGGAPMLMATRWSGHQCSLEECHEAVKSLGFCNTHYLRYKRTGDPRHVKRIASLDGVVCSLDDCDSDAFAKGLCKIHYGRKLKHGDPYKTLTVSWNGVSCSVPACQESAKIRGYCERHYRRWRSYGDPEHEGRSVLPAQGHSCLVEGCSNERKANGMCGYHAQRAYKASNPMLVKLASQRRRARKLGAFVVKYSHRELAQRMSYFGNRCWMCSGPFEEVDHVKPLSQGGKDCLANLRPSCRKCNRSKSGKWFGPKELHRFIKS